MSYAPSVPAPWVLYMPCWDPWPHSSREVDMALSDQLTGLAARAKEAEDRAAAAQGKAKADLQADVETA
jgi:hypothetical protein